jgi:hypothetical protein
MAKKTTTFNLEEDFVNRLRLLAKKEMRSLSNMLEVLIDKNAPKLDEEGK